MLGASGCGSNKLPISCFRTTAWYLRDLTFVIGTSAAAWIYDTIGINSDQHEPTDTFDSMNMILNMDHGRDDDMMINSHTGGDDTMTINSYSRKDISGTIGANGQQRVQIELHTSGHNTDEIFWGFHFLNLYPSPESIICLCVRASVIVSGVIKHDVKTIKKQSRLKLDKISNHKL